MPLKMPLLYLVVLAGTDVHAVVPFGGGLPVDVGASVALLLVRAEAPAKALLVAMPVGRD